MVTVRIAALTLHMSHDLNSSTTPIRSEYADDPDFRELLGDFTSALPDRRDNLLAAHRTGVPEDLRVQAHRLKGAGGGYGFPELSELAAALEVACRNHEPARMAEALEALVRYMNRITP